MGASCSSRSDPAAVVVTTTPTALSDRDPPASRQTTAPLLTYLAELEASDRDSRELDRRRLRWRRDYRTRRRFLSATEQDDADRQHEIEVLQQSLAAMEDFFQSLLGQAHLYMEAMDPAGSGTGGPPPASEEALRGLRSVALSASDIVEESNRTCGICCETHAIGDYVKRLPCGHVYHGPCIEAWLNRHCTCPVCRYELATDDAAYEPGRLERMRTRKLPSECEIMDEEAQDLQDLFDEKVVKT